MNQVNDWIDDLLESGNNEEAIHRNINHSQEIEGLDSKWQVVDPTFENTFFTIDQSQTTAWVSAKNELECIEKNLLEICHRIDILEVKEDEVIDLFFRLKVVCILDLLEHIEMDMADLGPFMSRYCLLSFMRNDNSSMEKILSTLNSNINEMMSEHDFNQVFKNN